MTLAKSPVPKNKKLLLFLNKTTTQAVSLKKMRPLTTRRKTVKRKTPLLHQKHRNNQLLSTLRSATSTSRLTYRRQKKTSTFYQVPSSCPHMCQASTNCSMATRATLSFSDTCTQYMKDYCSPKQSLRRRLTNSYCSVELKVTDRHISMKCSRSSSLESSVSYTTHSTTTNTRTSQDPCSETKLTTSSC